MRGKNKSVEYKDYKLKRYQTASFSAQARYDVMEKMRSKTARKQFDHKPYCI